MQGKQATGKREAFPDDCCRVTEAAAKATEAGFPAGQCVSSTEEVCTRVRDDADDAAAVDAAADATVVATDAAKEKVSQIH